jgi:uncharacterized protein YjaZ
LSIERTDLWMERDFNKPLEICKRFIISSQDEPVEKIYDYLLRFGMYRPNRSAKESLDELIKKEFWLKVKSIEAKYRNMWNGPDIPIYIFPLNSFQKPKDYNKSGLSLKDEMFLFLDPRIEVKELEALFVHEYHHVCRLNKIPKPFEEFTLLDSMVMEGLAELAVSKYCGKSYNAKWISYYSKEKLESYWKKHLLKNFHIKITDQLHDVLLYGKGFIPNLLGYAAGYYLVTHQNETRNLSIQESFTIHAEELYQSFSGFD